MKKESRIIRVVEAIKSVGPRNCSLISRITGIPVETVRYKIHEQLISKGVRIHAVVDYNKLGLRRNWATLNFTEEYNELAPKILDRLSSMGYLTYYGRVLPQGNIVSLIAIPIKVKGEYEKFLDDLMDYGILASYRLDELDRIHFHSMKPEHYNFSKGAWNVDWEALNRSETPVKGMMRNYNGGDEAMADKKDLLIIEKLQVDSTASIAEIARKLQMKPKTALYHYNEHIVKRRLITGYKVRWQASAGRSERYSHLGMVIEFRNLTKGELLNAEEAFHRLPLTWFDAKSSDQSLYLVYLSLPVSQYIYVLNYLWRNISNQKYKIRLIDALCSQGYTIPYEMFDETQGWTFHSEKVIEALRDSVLLTGAIKTGR